MYLSRHANQHGPRWALDQHWLPAGLSLSALLALPRTAMLAALNDIKQGSPADGDLLTPVEAAQEVWGSGVTYLRSREARKAESTTADVYQKVYDAERPEIFFKQLGWRTVGSGQFVRIRRDTRPECESWPNILAPCRCTASATLRYPGMQSSEATTSSGESLSAEVWKRAASMMISPAPPRARASW